MTKKVLFHIGRGGRFYNQGHKTCEGIIDSFNPEYYGVNIYFNEDEENPEIRLENGNVVCTLEDLNSDNGAFNIDGEYDTYVWKTINKLSELELAIMVRGLNTYEYKDLLIENGLDRRVFDILNASGDLSKHIAIIYNEVSFEDFINFDEVNIYNSEEEALEDGSRNTFEIEGKYYSIN